MDRLAWFLESTDPFLEPALLCQVCFVSAASGVLAVAATPRSARALLTQYGARSSSSGEKDKTQESTKPSGFFVNLISCLTSFGQVPHSWFIHFYFLSVLSSGFWAAQYLYGGAILTTLCEYQVARRPAPTMNIQQVQLVWLLMALQGTRRLYECFYVFRTSSSSKMWFVHWLLGCTYYLGIGVAVWIEGSYAILQSESRSFHLCQPSLRQIAGVLLFLTAWFMQYRCHKHLAGLKKYSLPQEGLFRHLICPHYTCECLLYFAMAVVATPKGELCNKTLLYGVVFVAVNLGVTASGTRRWYSEKFGKEQIKDKWSMIPLVF